VAAVAVPFHEAVAGVYRLIAQLLLPRFPSPIYVRKFFFLSSLSKKKVFSIVGPRKPRKHGLDHIGTYLTRHSYFVDKAIVAYTTTKGVCSMFKRLSLYGNDIKRHADSAFKRLDLVESDKQAPVDPHSLEVLRDGNPHFLAPVGSRRSPGRRVLWRRGDR
jgi:hypothetical protein